MSERLTSSPLDLRVHPEIAQASTLPATFYKSQEIFQRVREEIFARSWQFVGDTDDVRDPGSVRPFTLLEGFLDEPMVVTRDLEDRLHVLSNVCTHRGMQVVEGCGHERALRCRYHGRRFGLDGTFQSMPEFEGVCGFPSKADNLPEVPWGQWGKFLFAGVAPSITLEETLRPMIERLGWLDFRRFQFRPDRGRDYLVRASWALYIDNYLEGFHIPFVHSALNDVLDYGNYLLEHFPTGNLQLAHAKPGEDRFDLPPGSPDYGKDIAAYYYWFFPNTMFNFYPWGLSVNVVRPLGPDLTKVSFIPYVFDESRLDRGAGADLDRVEREDEAVVELVQRGVRSRFYDKGRFSPAREGNVHQFHRMLSAALM